MIGKQDIMKTIPTYFTCIHVQKRDLIYIKSRRSLSPMQTILYLSFPLSHVAGTKLCENMVHRREFD